MLAGKKLFAITLAALAMTVGTVGYGYTQYQETQESFFGDGYIMTVEERDGDAVPTPVYFDAGSNYQVKYPNQVAFKDNQGGKVKLDYDNFVHFADGSISALTDGVLMELDELKNGYINYYNVTPDSIMQNNGGIFLLDNNGTTLEFKDFIWKLSESKYLVSSSVLNIILPNKETVILGDYVEMNYIDDGIVQLVSEGKAYQVLSVGTDIELENGMVINTDNKMIRNGEQDMISLDAILAESGMNITVTPSAQQAQMKVPKFDITTVDGINGVSGEVGETGEAGEIGEEGDAGDEGEKGAEGEVGKEGKEGEGGSGGNTGIGGNSGSSGSSGATGGTGGGSGSGGSSTVVMPTISVEKFDYDAGILSGVLVVDSGKNVTVGEAQLILKDMVNGTSEVIETYDLSGALTLEFSKGGLKSDWEYQVVLEGEYKVDKTDAEGNELGGTRSFFVRNFNTNALGVSEEYDFATETTLSVILAKKSYSRIMNYTVTYAPVSGDESELFINGTFDQNKENITIEALNPNTEYSVRLTVTDPDATESPEVDISTHRYKTLKTPPVIGAAPIAVFSPRGYFEFKPGTGTAEDGTEFFDPHGGIQTLRYEIYTIGTSPRLVSSVETKGTSPVTAYIDGTNLRYGTTYQVKLVAVFFDNEKTVEFATPYSEQFFADANVGAPYMRFISQDHEPQFEEDPVTGAVRYESFKGDLEFYFNNADLLVSDTNRLRFTMYSEAFYDEKELITYSVLPGANATSIQYNLPDISGLRTNTTYRFNAYGYYNGDTSESLLATCVVTTPSPKKLTVHIKPDSGDETLNAKIYFTGEDNSDTDQLEIHTLYRMNLSLYDGLTKKGSAVFQFKPKKSETLAQRRYTSKAEDYYGTSGGNYCKLTNLDFNLNSSDLNNASGNYKIVVEGACAYDYTAQDELKYTSGNFTNKIELLGDTEATISVTEVAPPLPKEKAMEVTTILNGTMSDFGFASIPGLPGLSITGYVLSPHFDNTSQFATRADYYIYEKHEYETYEARLKNNTDEAINDPLALSSPRGYEPLMHYSYDLTDVKVGEDGYMPKLIVLMGEIPGDMKDKEYGTVFGDSEWKGTRYIYANKYNQALQDAITEQEDLEAVEQIPRVERGKKYYFPYDVNLAINENKAFRYPYDYSVNNGAEGSYLGPEQILKNQSAVEVARSAPQIYMYPYWITNQEAAWNVRATDPDRALDTSSFVAYNTTLAGGKVVSKSLEDAKQETEAEGGDFDIVDYLSKYKQIAFDTTSIRDTDKTLGIRLVYNAFYSGDPEAENDGPDVERAEVAMLTQPYQHTNQPMVKSIKIMTGVDANNNPLTIQATIERDNMVTFQIVSASVFDNVTALRVTLSNAGKNAKTFDLVPVYKGADDSGTRYTATLPLTDIVEFLGENINIVARLIYEKDGYGFKENPPGEYAIQDSAGLYYVEDALQNKLNGSSDKMGSIFNINDYTFNESNFTVPYAGKIYGREGNMSLRLGVRGLIWSGAAGTDTTMVLKPLTPTTWSVNDLAIRFDSMKPTISSVSIAAGLKNAEMTFRLTNGIDKLLQDGEKATIRFQIYKRVSGTDKPVQTIGKTLTALKEEQTNGTYGVKFEGLDLGSQYFVRVSGQLNGGNGSWTPFLDSSSKDNYIEFFTLSEVVGTRNTQGMRNSGYNNKWIYGGFDLNTIVGVTFRYDLYEWNSGGEDGPEGSLVYNYKEMLDRKILEVPEQYSLTGNRVTVHMSPPTKLRFGAQYNVRVRVYPAGTDIGGASIPDESECVGKFWLFNEYNGMKLYTYPTPEPRITMSLAEGTYVEDQKTYQKMNCNIYMQDTSKTIVSDYEAEYEETSTGNWVVNKVYLKSDPGKVPVVTREGEPDTSKLSGAYMIRIMVAEYTTDGDGKPVMTGRWAPIETEQFSNPLHAEYNDNTVLHGSIGISLKKLELDKEYRINAYAIVDGELVGMECIKAEDIVGNPKALLGYATQHTLDENGVYIDAETLEVEQTSSTEISTFLYNAAGMDRIKYVEYNFVPETPSTDVDYSVYTGIIPYSKLKGDESQEGANRVLKLTLGDTSFGETGRYRVVIRMYGGDESGPNAEPIFSTTKYVRITKG